ncbi:M1 family metallopeptidase [Actinoplanes sp. N902-109]|uniref:M1 family metallopeptidase n=1 Tax=Actinoplanes sp. (strain N902-109) TaxID=649831 RepID=UPI000683E326|nr:M1 family metallopeptidase [Actinoplanes sp. N902-109]
MARRVLLACSVVITLLLAGAVPAAATGEVFRPGAAGIGDPYFPLAGNGGYDVGHYGLDITYIPRTGVLAGVATISARATANLSAFNLDFDGLTLRALSVDGRPAAWTRSGGELTVTPARGLRSGHGFTVVARYDGVPQVIDDPNLGASGVFRTDDGMVIVGQPEVASTWFPVNDHPRDKAGYTVRITAPKGLQAISNGVLRRTSTRGAWTTTTWEAREPMASYLATATVGEYRVSAYRKKGLRYWDAIDPKLSAPQATPRTGTRMAISGIGEPTYKRLTRTVAVPATGGSLSFWVDRDTETFWDFFLVEARTAGGTDWTTLPDVNGHTSADPGAVCFYAPQLHPFLLHYVTPDGENCTPRGSTGTWSAATGASDGYEQWTVDLSGYAGRTADISLTAVADDVVTRTGAVVDDVVSSTGEGSTSFEGSLDGWVAGPAPEGSAPNPVSWIAGTTADLPPTVGEFAAAALAREPEILDFLSATFGPYPFSVAGGIVDSSAAFGFALETQTRPVYAQAFFTGPQSEGVVVHELAHQWYGDSLAVGRWQDIWLNEGFASYAEWLWAEHEGRGSVQQSFDAMYDVFNQVPELWQLPIGDPGPTHLFDAPVYQRGAMTLHALRLAVGDAVFFRILRTWAATRAGGTVTTPEFVALAERISGKQLHELFDAWLFAPVAPAVPTIVQAPTALVGRATVSPPEQIKRHLRGVNPIR